jgi:hypothetical protein
MMVQIENRNETNIKLPLNTKILNTHILNTKIVNSNPLIIPNLSKERI